MKKKFTALLMMGTLLISPASVSGEETDDSLLPFGFTVQEFAEDFSNFGSFNGTVVTHEPEGHSETTYIMIAENKDGIPVSISLLADSEDYVLNIGVDRVNDYEYGMYTLPTDLLENVLKATDMHLDSEQLVKDFNVEDESKNEVAPGFSFKHIYENGIFLNFSNQRLDIQRDRDNPDDYDYIEIISNSSSDIPLSEESSTEARFYLEFGKLLDANPKGGINMDELIIKAKIEPSLTNQMTIDQNYLNIKNIILEQDGGKFSSIQYWAVADMNDGNEGKVISFTVDRDCIDAILDGLIASADSIEEYLTDLWILPSLEK